MRPTIEQLANSAPNRKCGGCVLCCRLTPVAEISKPALTRCEHQRTGKGCAIYDHRPMSCRAWSCRWLIDPDAVDLRRPDRSHYVVDSMWDYIETQVAVHTAKETIPVIQVWVDPNYPNAHEDPALRAYLQRQAEQHGCAALIRYGSRNAFVLFPPALCSDGQWHEQISTLAAEREHSAAEVFAALSSVIDEANQL